MIQEKPVNGKNHITVIQLKLLGYRSNNIRKALHKLTGKTQPEMAEIIGTSRQTVTVTINGDRKNPDIQKKIADLGCSGAGPV